ncbi:type 1 fimbrial protein [Photobacterium damselae]|nr:type 1 fimbrial protein [Photobacterium damselae]
MKKSLMLVSLAPLALLASGAFAANLEVQFNGAITDSACEPVIIEGGAVSPTNSIDLGTYSVVESTKSGVFGDEKSFEIGQKDASECTSVKAVSVQVSGMADTSLKHILKNTNTDIANVGFLLKDRDSVNILNQSKEYTTGLDSLAYTVQLFNLDGVAPKTGAVTGVVDYTLAYK